MNATNTISAQGLELIAAFAKTNKVSRAKIEEIVAQVLTVEKTTKRPVGRPRTKRDTYHAEVMKFAAQSGGKFSRAQLEASGMKMVAFACKTLEAEGKIERLVETTKPANGKAGRPSVTYRVVA